MKTLLFALCITLIGCTTPYGKAGIAGGYSDARIDENTFTVHVQGNGYTAQQTVSIHAMYRAAELTAQNGFDYFLIVDGSNGATTGMMAMPGQSYTTVNAYGNTAYATTTTTPGMLMPIRFPNSTLTIKTFKGAKPNVPNAYEAHTVMKYLGPQILGDLKDKEVPK